MVFFPGVAYNASQASQRTKLTDECMHNLLDVYASRHAVKQLSQPLGPPQLAWLEIVDQHILEKDTDSDCDDVDGVYYLLCIYCCHWYYIHPVSQNNKIRR